MGRKTRALEKTMIGDGRLGRKEDGKSFGVNVSCDCCNMV